MPIPFGLLLAGGLMRGLSNVRAMERDPRQVNPILAQGTGNEGAADPGEPIQNAILKMLLAKLRGPQAQPMQAGQLPLAMNLFGSFPGFGG